MRSLNNLGITPPGGFRWRCQETGQWVPATGSMVSYTDFIYACRLHCNANRLPIGSQWEQQIQDQLCVGLDGEYCNEGGYPVAPLGGWGFDFVSVMQGTFALGAWLLKGKGKKVEPAEAGRRAAICVNCPMNQVPVGCNNCTMATLRDAAISVVGGATTAYDNQLQSCKVCGCALRAKIHLPLDILQGNLTEMQKKALPDNCWLK